MCKPKVKLWLNLNRTIESVGSNLLLNLNFLSLLLPLSTIESFHQIIFSSSPALPLQQLSLLRLRQVSIHIVQIVF
ncbi:hypothetical protein AQUCO_02300162v1 [Aquilegia coerulea]|uniref:Uncharacterized protein n=1 Tax=Aquilegia coerulea TaxID=218851 RepID=A0A2G5DCB8_AQUCA|nr:hypothetical protein AQUCO_02300162v1 [Aquilegia coerulea]